ncbi:hypothetical protein [Nonomuraea sp. GTA35]|uniref:hypothetical protein n=1 Tax=Nonomuraea sp. GTA35 TaxID=1676746 RepID=UPI0035BF5B43
MNIIYPASPAGPSQDQRGTGSPEGTLVPGGVDRREEAHQETLAQVRLLSMRAG